MSIVFSSLMPNFLLRLPTPSVPSRKGASLTSWGSETETDVLVPSLGLGSDLLSAYRVDSTISREQDEARLRYQR